MRGGRQSSSACGPSRRVLLRAIPAALALPALGAAVSGCQIRLEGTPPAAKAAGPGPDELARRRALLDTRQLLANLRALAASRTDLAEAATTWVRDETAHESGLATSTPVTPTGSTPATPPVGSPAAPTPGASPPSDPLAAVLLGAVTAAAHSTADLLVTSPGMARLLASLAAYRTIAVERLAAAAHAAVPAAPAAASTPVATATPSPKSGSPTPSASPSPALTAAATQALSAALAGEHAAVYAYGLLAARLPGALRQQALADLAAHVLRRDRLIALLTAGGAQPPAAALAYTLSGHVDTPDQAAAVAATLEERLAALDATATAQAPAALRQDQAAALVDAERRAVAWRGSLVPFPGMPERA